ncbi:MAG: Rieske 2Fe-2S domain-containing protein [Pirellulales bacterium]|nr:Rieske 2Fe-2S domain-containing protein [Pirellulales bacterium]
MSNNPSASSDQEKPSCCCCGATSGNNDREPRRGFIAVVLGIIALATPLVVGLITFFNPMRLKGQAGRFFRIATLDALPADGTPRKFPVIADRKDAWTIFPNEPIGSLFLSRVGNKTDKVEDIQALCVICPHAGCFIGYDEKNKNFLCPCHTAHFDLAGKRTDEQSQSPRDMDTLEVDVRNGNEIWVKFQNFRTGSTAKVAKT